MEVHHIADPVSVPLFFTLGFLNTFGFSTGSITAGGSIILTFAARFGLGFASNTGVGVSG